MAHHTHTATRPAARTLIASDRVEGTSIYSPEGEKLGAIHHLMINKRDGRVEYAVMSFGGLFGLGEGYYPLPWHTLDYDPERGGYVAQLDSSLLNADSPHYGPQDDPDWDRDFASRLDTHYERVRL